MTKRVRLNYLQPGNVELNLQSVNQISRGTAFLDT